MKKSKKPLLLLLFIPIVIAALTFWHYSRNGAVIRVEADGGAVIFEDEESIALFLKAIKGAQEIEEAVRPLSEYKAMGIKLVRFFGEEDYIFRFSGATTDCLFTDAENKLYKIETKCATQLMLMEGLEAASSGYQLPEISLKTDTAGVSLLESQKVLWNFRLADSTYAQREQPAGEPPRIEANGEAAPKIRFSISPDWNSVTVTKGEKTVFDGDASGFKDFIYQSDGELEIVIKAKWNQTDGAEYYGEATAKAVLIYDAKPEFELSEDVAVPGDLLALHAKNCDNDGVSVRAGFLDGKCAITVYEGEKIALIPVPIDTEPGEYTIRASSEGVNAEFTVTVDKKRFSTVELQTVDASDMESAHDSQKAVLEGLPLSASDTAVWSGEFTSPLKGDDVWISAAFGSFYSVDGEECRVRQEGLDYVGEIGSDVKAVGDGTVIFADTAPFTGNTVIIDHGAGVWSVYGNLQTVSVTKDMKVVGSQNVGTLGNTGFAGGKCLHFEMRVNLVPVNPLTVFLGKRPDFFGLKNSTV